MPLDAVVQRFAKARGDYAACGAAGINLREGYRR